MASSGGFYGVDMDGRLVQHGPPGRNPLSQVLGYFAVQSTAS